MVHFTKTNFDRPYAILKKNNLVRHKIKKCGLNRISKRIGFIVTTTSYCASFLTLKVSADLGEIIVCIYELSICHILLNWIVEPLKHLNMWSMLFTSIFSQCGKIKRGAMGFLPLKHSLYLFALGSREIMC